MHDMTTALGSVDIARQIKYSARSNREWRSLETTNQLEKSWHLLISLVTVVRPGGLLCHCMRVQLRTPHPQCSGETVPAYRYREFYGMVIHLTSYLDLAQTLLLTRAPDTYPRPPTTGQKLDQKRKKGVWDSWNDHPVLMISLLFKL